MKPVATLLAALSLVTLAAACGDGEPDQIPSADAGTKTGCLDGRTGAQGACSDAGVDASDGG